jgi:hypothetical protein
VELQVKVSGAGTEDVETGVQPSSVTLTRNGHKSADTLEVEINASALPFDPRKIQDLGIALYLGDVGSMAGDVKQDRYLRFVACVDKLEPAWAADKAPTVKLSARDHSGLLRDTKRLPPRAMPTYADTLLEAIRRVLDATVAGPMLHTTPSPDFDIPLSTLVPARLRNTTVQVKRESTAWEVIEHVCGLVGRQPRVVLDDLVLVHASDEFASQGPAAAEFVYGSDQGNLLDAGMEKLFQRNRKGVQVVSYDPVARTTNEAVYPPESELPNRGRARVRGRRGRAAARPKPADRDRFEARDGTGPDRLQEIARQIYEERSRQEMTVTVTTPEPAEAALALRNGDRVSIKINPDLEAEVRRTQDDAAAARFLQRRLGLTAEAALVLVHATRQAQQDRFYTRKATIQWQAAGKTTVQIEAVNLIEVQL